MSRLRKLLVSAGIATTLLGGAVVDADVAQAATGWQLSDLDRDNCYEAAAYHGSNGVPYYWLFELDGDCRWDTVLRYDTSGRLVAVFDMNEDGRADALAYDNKWFSNRYRNSFGGIADRYGNIWSSTGNVSMTVERPTGTMYSLFTQLAAVTGVAVG